jgi:phosphatidate cytidylyltransferase
MLTWAPLWLFKVLLLVLIAAALNEFYRLVLPNDKFSLITGILFGLVFAAILIFNGPTGVYILPVILSSMFVLILAHMIYFTVAEGTIARLGLILFGTAYLSLTLPTFVWLRDSDHGRFLIVITISIVALGDTFAMVTGKLIGRHKMSPLISPKKTVEGLLGSFIGGLVAAVICWQFFWPALPMYLIIFLGISVALIGALGDLVESLIKRAYHVKDSGTLLPGHGGILDRLDALVFTAPFVYYTFKFLGWI